MKAHHQRRGPLFRGRPGAQHLRGAAQHLKGTIGRVAQPGVGVERHPGLEHRRIVRRLTAGKGEVGAADILERRERVGTAVIPCVVQRRLEQLEAAARDIGKQRIAIAEMTVGRRRADPGRTRGVGKGEPGRPLLGDQVERGADQRLAQIAVVIPSTAVAIARSRPAHVRCFYMSRPAIETLMRRYRWGRDSFRP